MPEAPQAPEGAAPRPATVCWSRIDQATVVATGTDAARFVDNFVTGSVAALAVGSGTEAFVADARGQVIALVTLLRTEAGLEIVAGAGLGERLRDHLEHYHIREAVDIVDATHATQTLLVAGTGAADVIMRLALTNTVVPTADLGHAMIEIAGHATRVVRVVGQGADGYWIRSAPDAIHAISDAIDAAGVPRCTDADLEAARILAGYPAPVDIPEKTLPAELGRDGRAISFTKGCYLGQETVARLDALGHVNRRLAILAIDAKERPVCPSEVHHGDAVVGTLTSVCLTAAGWRGLGVVHAKALDAPRLTINAAQARIIPLPR